MLRSMFIISILITLFCWSNLTAQTSVLFTSYLIRDDNAFKSREAYDEWINNSSLQLGHQLLGDDYRLSGYYSADLYSYAKTSALNSLAHKFGLAGTRYVHDYTFNVNVSARLRHYNEPFIYYNVNRYDIHASMQHAPNLSNMYYAGVQLNKDKYTEFSDLDNIAYKIYGKYQHFYQSKISLTGYASFGVKNYVNQSIIKYYGVGTLLNPFARYREEPVKAALFSTNVNVAKSLLPGLGLSLMLGGQWFVGDPIAAYSQGIYYYTENDLYDDPYSYQGTYATLQLTKQFGIGFQAKAGIKLQNKDYAGTPALDENGYLLGETRFDKRNEYYFFVTKKFQTGLKVPSSFDLFFNLMYRQNPSNDPYYDFDDHIGLLGFSVGL